MSTLPHARALAIARRFQLGVVAAIAALVILVSWWFLEAGISVGHVLLAAGFTSPLWLTAPWLLAGSRRSYAWTTLIVVPYFVLGITEAVANPHARGWAGLCLLVAFAVFVMSIAYLRMTRAPTQQQ